MDMNSCRAEFERWDLGRTQLVGRIPERTAVLWLRVANVAAGQGGKRVSPLRCL